jgi:hypothetical protein
MANETSAKECTERMPQIMMWIDMSIKNRHGIELSDTDISALRKAAKIVQAYADGRLVEVVRCGDCVNKTFCSCVMDERYGDDDFCSYGERKDGEKG